jgi:hypothetical protein
MGLKSLLHSAELKQVPPTVMAIKPSSPTALSIEMTLLPEHIKNVFPSEDKMSEKN